MDLSYRTDALELYLALEKKQKATMPRLMLALIPFRARANLRMSLYLPNVQDERDGCLARSVRKHDP
jgi:hypothetical protein